MKHRAYLLYNKWSHFLEAISTPLILIANKFLNIGYIYEAFDKNLKKNVALKIEKKDKNKSILIFEYNVLNLLKGNSYLLECASHL